MSKPSKLLDVSAGYMPLPYLEDHVADHLRKLITSSSFGCRLPSEREMANQLSVSRPVVRAALTKLEAAGLISRRHGATTKILAGMDRKPSAEPAPGGKRNRVVERLPALAAC